MAASRQARQELFISRPDGMSAVRAVTSVLHQVYGEAFSKPNFSPKPD
jgi:hypothetical protein